MPVANGAHIDLSWLVEEVVVGGTGAEPRSPGCKHRFTVVEARIQSKQGRRPRELT